VKAILPDFGPARQNAAFRRLLAGGLLSALGSSMTSFALVLESGTVATLTSPTISAVSGGVGCFVIAVLIACTIPVFTRYRAGEAPAPEAVSPEAASADTAPAD
jgi:hypothetical protein